MHKEFALMSTHIPLEKKTLVMMVRFNRELQ